MNGLRRARRFGRLLAAWLLLSFIAMAAAPLGSLPQADPLAASSTPFDEHCSESEHHGAHEQAVSVAHDPEPDAGHPHAGHATHCPLCLHAAAPPPPPSGQRVAHGPVAGPPVAREHAEVRVASAAPPPGRGPPIFS